MLPSLSTVTGIISFSSCFCSSDFLCIVFNTDSKLIIGESFSSVFESLSNIISNTLTKMSEGILFEIEAGRRRRHPQPGRPPRPRRAHAVFRAGARRPGAAKEMRRLP